MGASAGGHLACLTAVTADGGSGDGSGTAVKAAGVFFPLTDLLNYNGQVVDPRSDGRLGQLVRQLAFPKGINGLSDADLTKGVTQICPARLVTKNAPPFLFIHGDADPVVPLQQSQLMVETLKKEGVSAELIVKPGGGHPWLTMPEEVQKLADWFDKQLAAK
jgi:acetyl esterase/lipase